MTCASFYKDPTMESFNPVKPEHTTNTSILEKRPLFPLGQVVITSHAQYLLATHQIDASLLVHRHQRGDWGDLCQTDKETNEEALISKGRLLSSYDLPIPDMSLKLWIITEWDRSITTLLLPEDY